MEISRSILSGKVVQELESEVKRLQLEVKMLKQKNLSLHLKNSILQKRDVVCKNKAVQANIRSDLHSNISARRVGCLNTNTKRVSFSDDEKLRNKSLNGFEPMESENLNNRKTEEIIATPNVGELKMIENTNIEYLYSTAKRNANVIQSLILEGSSEDKPNNDTNSASSLTLPALLYCSSQLFLNVKHLKLVNIGRKLDMRDMCLIANCFPRIISLSLVSVQVNDQLVSVLINKLEHLKKVEIISSRITGECFHNVSDTVEELTWRF